MCPGILPEHGFKHKGNHFASLPWFGTKIAQKYTIKGSKYSGFRRDVKPHVLPFSASGQRPFSSPEAALLWSAPRIATSGLVQRHSVFEWLCKHNRLRSEPIRLAGVNVKAVFTSLNTAFLPISRSRFKRRQIPMLITLSTIWQFCVNFWVIFRCFGKERFFLKG